MLPANIKKEDAKSVLKSQKLYMVFVLLGMAVTLGVVDYFIRPKIFGLYNDMGVKIPIITETLFRYALAGVGGLVILAGYILSTNFMDTRFEATLLKYKDGEMIKIRELWQRDVEWAVMLALGLGVGFLVVAIIMPIYSLTNSF